MEFFPEYRDLVSIGVSVLCGSLVGIEREYRNKSAGFRTVVLICLGSTVFTIISRFGVGTDDRIAANIITGVGFIGAGVIFKGKLSVLGLTTAAVIWIAAGIGMAAGAGYHSLAIAVTILTLVILIFFSKIEKFMEVVHLTNTIYITFNNTDRANLDNFHELIIAYKIKAKRKLIAKKDGRLTAIYEVSSNRKHIMEFNDELVDTPYVLEFHYN